MPRPVNTRAAVHCGVAVAAAWKELLLRAHAKRALGAKEAGEGQVQLVTLRAGPSQRFVCTQSLHMGTCCVQVRTVSRLRRIRQALLIHRFVWLTLHSYTTQHTGRIHAARRCKSRGQLCKARPPEMHELASTRTVAAWPMSQH